MSDVIEGILEQARSEAEKILGDTEATVDARKSALQTRVDRIREDAEKRAAEEATKIKRRYESAIAVEERRARLRVEKEVYKTVVRQVEERIRSLIGTEEYDAILSGWITEALVGLGAPSALVQVSNQEINHAERVLDGATKRAARILGRECSVALDTDHPLSQIGVVALSEDGTTAYNNQLPTQLSRHEDSLRAIVSEEVLETDET